MLLFSFLDCSLGGGGAEISNTTDRQFTGGYRIRHYFGRLFNKRGSQKKKLIGFPYFFTPSIHHVIKSTKKHVTQTTSFFFYFTSHKNKSFYQNLLSEKIQNASLYLVSNSPTTTWG